jgi:hypothetical protein
LLVVKRLRGRSVRRWRKSQESADGSPILEGHAAMVGCPSLVRGFKISQQIEAWPKFFKQIVTRRIV